MSDPRPWVTWTIKLPEPVRTQLESAINVLQLAGKATNPIEALEAMAAEVIHGELPGLLYQAKHESKTALGVARWVAFFNAGWRCLICGTSRHLQCHHGLPRSQGGTDTEDNLFPVCADDHRRITENEWPWELALPWLRKAKLQRLQEVNGNGWVTRRDRTGELARTVQGESVGGDTGELEHTNRAMGG